MQTLYLLRHGEARSELEDPQRSLTQDGEEQVEKMARWAAGFGLRVAQIRHSGRRRAEQTAQIFGRYLHPPDGVISVRGLDPHDDVQTAADALGYETGGPWMLVGHLPFLNRLADRLLIRDAHNPIEPLPTAGLLCLEHKDGRWHIAWVRTPSNTP